MSNLHSFKQIMVFVIFLFGFIGVISPRLFNAYGSNLSYASLFSSGVLLSAAMVHLLGDAADGLADSPLPDFPWAYFLCCLSFYSLYFFEIWITNLLLRHSHKSEEISLPHTDQTAGIPLLPSTKSISNVHNETVDYFHSHHGEDLLTFMEKKNHFTGFVLLIGLGLHSFLAGIGFGASSEIKQAFALAIAIVSHKYLAAFALGCPFYKSGVAFKKQVVIALIFSVITPLGIGVGLLLSDGLQTYVTDVFISIAAGTFVYVAIVEILIPEFKDNAHGNDNKIDANKHGNGFNKGLSVLTGFLLMSMLAIWV
eukprot:298811_1